MATIFSISACVAILLNITEDIAKPIWLPLGGSQMSQMGILFFGMYAVWSLVGYVF
tara:strand:- start:363 stop:530 length:168 start_codon:yes stop_codon:yes gene_type:complete